MHSNHWNCHLHSTKCSTSFSFFYIIKEKLPVYYYVILICSQLLFMVFKIQRRDAFLFVLYGCLFTDVLYFVYKSQKYTNFYNIFKLEEFFVFLLSLFCQCKFHNFCHFSLIKYNTVEIFPWNFQHQLNVTIF